MYFKMVFAEINDLVFYDMALVFINTSFVIRPHSLLSVDVDLEVHSSTGKDWWFTTE